MSTLVSTLLTAILTFGYGSLFIFLPGYSLVFSLKRSKMETLSLSLITGFSLYSLVAYMVRFKDLPFFLIEIALIIFILLHQKYYRISLKKLFKISSDFQITPILWSLIIILPILALIHGAVLIRSGIKVSEGVSFVELSFHDSMQHISIIRRLWGSSIILHPGFSGQILTNYHYLIDLTLASMSRFPFVSLLDLYYRIYPITISLLFSLTIFVFSRQLTKNSTLSLFTVVFVLLAGNASFFARFIRGTEFSWGSNAFIINPIIDILQNPASIFVLAQLLTTLLLLHVYQQTHNSRTLWLIILLIIINAGTMIGFKAWGGLLINGSLGLASVFQLLRYRDPKLLIATLGVSIISALLFFPHYIAQKAARPNWAPGWTLERMVNDQDRWNKVEEIFLLNDFKARQQHLLVAKLFTKWTFIYIVGNYWVRVIGFLGLLLLLIKPTKLTGYHIALGSVAITSLILPLLFNQGRMAYDIEQFSPYAVVLISIYALVFLHQLASKYSIPKIYFYGLVFILLILAIPSNYTSIKARVSGETFTIPYEYFATYDKVNELTSPSDIILLSSSHRNRSTLRFAALTSRNTFYSGRTLSVITGEDHELRDALVARFFKFANRDEQNKVIRENNITHLFLYEEDRKEYQPDPNTVELLFENSAGSLYKYQYKY